VAPRLRAAAIAVTLLAIAAPPPAAIAAETTAPPSHLAAYGLDWLDYIDPADLPPTRSAVCLVDTGVAVTPDTPADDPVNGPILARLAGDGGSGEPFDTSTDQLHGTRMAMAAIAPQNGWGTIGTWTAGRVVSVRATRDGESTFQPEAYQAGIFQCLKARTDDGLPVAVVNFSLTCPDCHLSAQDHDALDNYILVAHHRGVSVVAAGGNAGGANAQVPASEPGVLAVAAGDPAGGLCGYGSFDETVAVLGPACPVDGADPSTGDPILNEEGGSSTAAIVTSTLLAALRTLRPDATWNQAEGWLRDSARIVDGRRVLDGVAAARAAGLDEVVERAEAREQAATSPGVAVETGTPTPTTTPTPTSTAIASPTLSPEGKRGRLSPPHARSVRWGRGTLTVIVAGRPRGARLEVVAKRVRGEFGWRAQVHCVRASSWVRLPVALRPAVVQMRYSAGARSSARVTLTRHGRRYS
jgi:hypothetical protein